MNPPIVILDPSDDVIVKFPCSSETYLTPLGRLLLKLETILYLPCPYHKQALNHYGLYDDVNDDDGYSPVKGLVHRYPTKVLIFPSNFCGCYCRYCFRRKLKRDVEDCLKQADYDNIFKYLREHPAINEVIFSGGDPLVVDDDILKYVLLKLSEIDSIKIVRFHTRMIITIPYRITQDFVDMLNIYKKRFAYI